MPIGDLLASITGEQPSLVSTTFIPKRKANDDISKPVQKIQKTSTQRPDSPGLASQPSKPSAVGSLISKATVPPGNLSTAVQNSSTSTFKNGQPTPPSSNDPPKPLKKGSFAEIMARGKKAQTILGQVGKIQHKKIEKLPSRREREDLKAQTAKNIRKGLDPNSKFQKPGEPLIRDGKNSMKENNGKTRVGSVPEKKVKKAATATTGYAGTARPKTGSAKPASKYSATPSSSRYDKDRYQDKRSSSSRYTYASEEEGDEEDDEDVEGYYSDASSDMEAAAFEVDEEEELAARIARKEDAEALAEENRLKREKEEKKRKLAAMANKANPRRY